MESNIWTVWFVLKFMHVIIIKIIIKLLNIHPKVQKAFKIHDLCQVFVTDSRISVYIDANTWVLVLYKVIPEDQATYECYVNSKRPQKLAINLNVKGIKLIQTK